MDRKRIQRKRESEMARYRLGTQTTLSFGSKTIGHMGLGVSAGGFAPKTTRGRVRELTLSFE
eukprot:538867-Pleurochrysis_carterae.AAC.1